MAPHRHLREKVEELENKVEELQNKLAEVCKRFETLKEKAEALEKVREKDAEIPQELLTPKLEGSPDIRPQDVTLAPRETKQKSKRQRLMDEDLEDFEDEDEGDYARSRLEKREQKRAKKKQGQRPQRPELETPETTLLDDKNDNDSDFDLDESAPAYAATSREPMPLCGATKFLNLVAACELRNAYNSRNHAVNTCSFLKYTYYSYDKPIEILDYYVTLDHQATTHLGAKYRVKDHKLPQPLKSRRQLTPSKKKKALKEMVLRMDVAPPKTPETATPRLSKKREKGARPSDIPKYVYEIGELWVETKYLLTKGPKDTRSTGCHFVVDIESVDLPLWLVYRYGSVEDGKRVKERRGLDRDEDMFAFLGQGDANFDVAKVADRMADWYENGKFKPVTVNPKDGPKPEPAAVALMKRTRFRGDPSFRPVRLEECEHLRA